MFLAEHQRREANSRGTLEQRLDQLTHEFQGPMTENEISFQHIAQTFRERGNPHEQLRGVVYNHIMNELEDIKLKFSRAEVWMSEVTRETDRRSREMRTSIGRFIRKVARLIEQATTNSQEISDVKPALPRVDLMENQIIRWRHRHPNLTEDDDGDSDEEVSMLTAHAICEHLGALQGATRRKIEELRQAIMAHEDRVNILRSSRDDTWQLVNDRLTTEVDRASATLSDRIAKNCAVQECYACYY